MSSKAVTRRDGARVSSRWCTTFSEATFRPLRSFSVESEDPVNCRTRQGGQACIVQWIDSIKDPSEFYEVLKARMPLDTKIYGYKDGGRCCTVLGFPYSFSSWTGLKDHFPLVHKTSKVELYVLEEGNNVDEWIEWMHVYCKAYPIYSSFRYVFGEEFVAEDLKAKKDSVLPTAGDMWKAEHG
jgi:hypothetical protein